MGRGRGSASAGGGLSREIWLVRSMEFDLGFFDEGAARVEPAENPFLSKLLPMQSVQNVTIGDLQVRFRPVGFFGFLISSAQ